MPDRRTVLKTMAGAGVLTAASYRRVLGANDRVRVGLIGNGLIGKRHLLDFQAQPDVEIAAVCEVSDERLDEAASMAGGTATRHKDFRRMLDRADVDAVVVSTPDHWHALMTILACAAGKDVYVEKPLTHALREGEWMLKTAAHHRCVVQSGTQQRSGRHYQRCRELVQAGHIGDVRSVSMGAHRNIVPGFTQAVGQPLSAADWDMWLGPAPFVPFDARRALYHFRWYWDYSGGQTTNLLAHEIDIVQWFTEALPKRVTAMSGRFALQGIGETPDVFEAIFEYPGFLARWSQREVAASGEGGLEFHGTRGMLKLNRRGFEVVPDKLISPEDQIPRFTAARPSTDQASLRTTAVKEEGFEQVRDQFVPHVRDFIDCVKSRATPVADLPSSHRTSISCHLANIAMKVGRVLRWDEAKGDVVGDPEASKLLTKEYRSPWDRELKGALPRA
jgi:predicted dehydrogenase